MPLNTEWLSTDKIENRLLTNIFSKILQYFSENKQIESVIDFCYIYAPKTWGYKFSYAQVLKYKNWLIKKRLITAEKQGRYEKLIITPKGKKLAKALNDFVKKVEGLENE